nr:retrotransposon protein, putative, Ty1-copia subclass [Tanacetum cinerariifolium]
KEGKPVGSYVIKMKNYMAQLEHHGYVLPHDLSVGLILNGITSDFAGFVRNHNKHNMWKTIDKLHALLIEQFKNVSPYEMLQEFKSMFEKQAKVEWFDLIQTFHACKQEEGKPVGSYVIKMKNYMAQLEHHGYVLPHDLSVGLILNGLTRDYFKMATTPQVMAIQSGRIQRANKKSLNAKRKGKGKGKGKDKSYIPKPNNNKKNLNLLLKEHPAKDDTCHHCKEGYDLESAARILNIVPTKKVDKTPYELWRAGELEEIQDEDTSPSEITSKIPIEVEGFETPQEEEAHVCRSERPHRAPDRLCLNVEVKEHSLGDINEPANYKAAILEPKSNKWLDAMNAKIQSKKDNQVWRLVDLPPNGKTVERKWIFKKKTDMDGNVHIYEARLVAKGFTQTYTVDYEETFSPVADIKAIRILIAIAAFYDYEIWQMVVKTAFLNGYLDEDIYMVQPEGFIDPKLPRKVCKLQRSIYGLKQASRSWNKIFDEEIKRFGFTKNLDEPCVYQNASGRNVTFLILMDNSKRSYIRMQEKLNLNKTQGASTPGEVKRMQNVPYASVVGSIMYAVRCTRPDVAFAQNITSRFQQNPGEPHWTAVKTILKYLRNTKDMFLVYSRNSKAELRVDCYCNAGFETNSDEIKSQT